MAGQERAGVTAAVLYGAMFAAGTALAAASLGPVRFGFARSHRGVARRAAGETVAAPLARRMDGAARTQGRVLRAVQGAAAALGACGGYLLTGLWGMAVLAGGLGVLLPPFVAAPAQRRRHTQEALAWQAWTRHLAELARSGAGLADALADSTGHAPPVVAATVDRVARTAQLDGLGPALDDLARAGPVWEPEIAAGLRIAVASGGPLAGPLADLAQRIGDIVDLHRTRTESVVQLWTQTIALLALAAGVVTLMYRNNPAYFEPYRTPTGQTVLMLIAFVLLGATAFLVRHSIVRTQPSVLVARTGRRRTVAPL